MGSMTDKKPINYRAQNSELETILARLQSGELDIDEALVQYSRGMAIIEELRKYLKEAENKVTKIKQKFD